MATKKTSPEAAVLEQYGVCFKNVKTQSTIASTMEEFGYTSEVIAIGENLYTETVAVYNQNKIEDDETTAASDVYKTTKKELEKWYKKHVQKARVAFRNDPVTKERLEIVGSKSEAYASWIIRVKKFYAEVTNDELIKAKIVRLKTPEEELTAAVTLIGETETARANYLREKGESEDATKQKDAALAKLDDWMSEFYDVAKIALEDHPQLLEALGLSVKS